MFASRPDARSSSRRYSSIVALSSATLRVARPCRASFPVTSSLTLERRSRFLDTRNAVVTNWESTPISRCARPRRCAASSESSLIMIWKGSFSQNSNSIRQFSRLYCSYLMGIENASTMLPTSEGSVKYPCPRFSQMPLCGHRRLSSWSGETG